MSDYTPFLGAHAFYNVMAPDTRLANEHKKVYDIQQGYGIIKIRTADWKIAVLVDCCIKNEEAMGEVSEKN